MLGRDFAAEGTVIRGAGRGKQLHVPTANLALDGSTMLPADGVYAVRGEVGGRVCDGVANIGVSPTFGAGPRSLEVHLLDYSRNLLGKRLRVSFVQRLRDEQKFENADSLVAQIKQDVRDALDVLRGEKSKRP
jgi:riboflavin kinase/FMN adenylyltransferase